MAVDNRGTSLFVTLTYPDEIGRGFVLRHEGGEIDDFSDFVVFVALKNGEHSGEGYLIDTGASSAARTLPLTEVFGLIERHFSEQLLTGRAPEQVVAAV